MITKTFRIYTLEEAFVETMKKAEDDISAQEMLEVWRRNYHDDGEGFDEMVELMRSLERTGENIFVEVSETIAEACDLNMSEGPFYLSVSD